MFAAMADIEVGPAPVGDRIYVSLLVNKVSASPREPLPAHFMPQPLERV
jgi:hypothetical protein